MKHARTYANYAILWHFIVYLLLQKIEICKEDRYESINILKTCYFVLLDATLGAWLVHDMSMHLIFSTLTVFEEWTDEINWFFAC